MPCSTHVHSNLTMSGAKAAEEGKNESTRISFVAISNISFRTVHPMFHPTFHPPILIFHQSRITARKEIRQGMIGTSSPLVFLFFFFCWFDFFFLFSPVFLRRDHSSSSTSSSSSSSANSLCSLCPNCCLTLSSSSSSSPPPCFFFKSLSRAFLASVSAFVGLPLLLLI